MTAWTTCSIVSAAAGPLGLRGSDRSGPEGLDSFVSAAEPIVAKWTGLDNGLGAELEASGGLWLDAGSPRRSSGLDPVDEACIPPGALKVPDESDDDDEASDSTMVDRLTSSEQRQILRSVSEHMSTYHSTQRCRGKFSMKKISKVHKIFEIFNFDNLNA